MYTRAVRSEHLQVAMELWEHRSAVLEDLALRTATTTPRTAAAQQVAAQLIEGQATLAKSTLELLRNVRRRAENLPNEVGLEIAAKCGERAIVAWNILLRCASNASHSDDPYLTAFDECRKLAERLKRDLQHSAQAAIQTADKLAEAEQARLSRYRDEVTRSADDRVSIDPDSPDAPMLREAQQALDQAAETILRLTTDLSVLERPGHTLTHVIVASGLSRCIPFLDKAIDGNMKSIARRFENYRSLAEIAPGLLGVALEVSRAPTGISSTVGILSSAFVRRWSEPLIGRRRDAVERTYRKVAVHTLTTFLLPFTACIASSFEILAAKDRLSLDALLRDSDSSA
jgi:hypothetical protein